MDEDFDGRWSVLNDKITKLTSYGTMLQPQSIVTDRCKRRSQTRKAACFRTPHI